LVTFQAPFIVLEGIDGTGKSTQTRLLVDWLHERGLAAVRVSDPGGTAVGDSLRAILLDPDSKLSLRTEAMLFMASRAELVERIIRPSLANGIIVISDRYLLSNVVYQGHAGGLDPDELWQIGHFATCGLEPDISFLLDLPLDEAEARRSKVADRLEARSRAFHEKVRDGFLYEASQQPEKVFVIDAGQPVERVREQLRERVWGLLRQRGFPLPEASELSARK
jgi:dTMP kinase